MSRKAETWAWEQSKATGTDFIVIVACGDYAHPDTDLVFPSISELAKKCRISSRTAHRSIDRLIELGELARTDKTVGRGVVVYRFTYGLTSDSVTEVAEARPMTESQRSETATETRPLSESQRRSANLADVPMTQESDRTGKGTVKEPNPPSPQGGKASADHRDDGLQGGRGSDDDGDAFERFAAAYPSGRIDPRGPAREIFERLVGEGTDPERMIRAASAYAVELDGGEIKPCFMRRFLEERRFEDLEAPPSRPSTGSDAEERKARAKRAIRERLDGAVAGDVLAAVEALEIVGRRGSTVILEAPSQAVADRIDASVRCEIARAIRDVNRAWSCVAVELTVRRAA